MATTVRLSGKEIAGRLMTQPSSVDDDRAGPIRSDETLIYATDQQLALFSMRDRIVKLLDSIEWIAQESDIHECPVCGAVCPEDGGRSDHPHATDCKLAAVLEALR
jgi:hypothetical protein